MAENTYHIYCISGLGGDERIFSKLKLNTALHHIKWIQPEVTDTLGSYVKKLSEQITHTENIVLLGVSFGGMVAIELNKLISVEKTIIISSIKHNNEKPDILSGWLVQKLYKLFVPHIIKFFPVLSYAVFGVTKKEERVLLKDLIIKADNYYLTWCVHKIMNWNNTSIPPNLYHIHGSKDRIFDISNISESIEIKGGTHFMVYNKAEEISKVINKILAH